MLHKASKLSFIYYWGDLLCSVLVQNKINWQKIVRIYLAETKVFLHVLLGNAASRSVCKSSGISLAVVLLLPPEADVMMSAELCFYLVLS